MLNPGWVKLLALLWRQRDQARAFVAGAFGGMAFTTRPPPFSLRFLVVSRLAMATDESGSN